MSAFIWFKLRVCVIAWRWQHIWVWNHLDEDEWIELFMDVEGNVDLAYLEGWCRE